MHDALVKTRATDFTVRGKIRKDDPKAVKRVLKAAGVFSAEEIAVGSSMASEALEKGAKISGLDYIFIENADGFVAGYACIGATPITQQSWDFFWLAVDPAFQGKGLAQQLCTASCMHVAKNGGRWLFAETSSLPGYAPARKFYESFGFEQLALIPDFYKPGDAKLIFRKDVTL
jgi:ribosomal protein S18 acetylase RimI-like enzyme